MRGGAGPTASCSRPRRNPENDALVGGRPTRLGVRVFRGDEDDVLKPPRRLRARASAPTHVVRVTGDNPLTDVETLERLRRAAPRVGHADYTYVPGDALLMGILSRGRSRPRALERSWQSGEARHRSSW